MVMVVRGYGRASTSGQVMSTAQQNSVCHDYFWLNKQVKPDWEHAEWGGWFADEAVSRDSEFIQREQGSRIIAASKPGDIIVAAKFDRTFVNAADVHNTLKYLQDNRIRIVVLDVDIDTTSPLGECFFKIMAALKELDVKETRARTKAALQYRKSVGRPSGKPPIGFKSVRVQRDYGKGRIEKYLVIDHAERRFADELFRIATEHNASARKAAQIFNEMKIKQPDKAHKWKHMMAWRWLNAAKHGYPLGNGKFEPAPIPPDGIIVEFKEVSSDD